MGKNETQNRKVRIFVLGVFAFLAAVWALLPEKIVFNSEPVCMHYRWIGIQCPLCGLSRAAYHLVHFQFSEAWKFNPLIFAVAWLYSLEWIILFSPARLFRSIRKFSLLATAVLVIWLYLSRITASL